MALILSLFSPEDYMLPCLSKQLLGIECFGCGIQRSVVLLFRGEFVAAFKMYPAIYTLILLFVFIILNVFIKFKYSSKIISVLAIINILIIIISYFLKLTN